MAMIEDDFKLEKNVPNTAAHIDQGNYKVFLSNLDIDRTLRMYKSLLKLSSEAVEAVANGRHADFSSITDFAYKNKAHSEIIKKTKERGWYSEDLFARFNIISQKTKIF